MIRYPKRLSTYLMATYMKQDSGLPANIWFDSIGVPRNKKHKTAIVKVQGDKKSFMSRTNYNLIPVMVSNPPKRLVKRKGRLTNARWNEIFIFLTKNKAIIQQHWNEEIDDEDLLNNLK